MLTISRAAPTSWWDSAGSTIADWWTSASDWLDRASDTTGKVILTLVVAIAVWILGRLAIRAATRGLRKGISQGGRRARRLLKKAGIDAPEPTLEEQLEATRHLQRAHTVSVVLRSALSLTVIVLTLAMLLSVIGVDVAPLLAGGAIVGVALGFGAQSLVKDLLSGMFMLVEDQYGLGDIIDVGEATGAVEAFGLRSTRLRSLDGTVWFIPNGEIRRVGNKSRLWSRAMIEVRIDFNEDVEQARQAILDATATAIAQPEIAPHVLGDPSVPGIEALESDAVMLRLLLQVQPAKQWEVQRAIRAEIQKTFRQRHIDLAVPENRVYTFDGVDGDTAPSRADAPAKPRAKKSPPKK